MLQVFLLNLASVYRSAEPPTVFMFHIYFFMKDSLDLKLAAHVLVYFVINGYRFSESIWKHRFSVQGQWLWELSHRSCLPPVPTISIQTKKVVVKFLVLCFPTALFLEVLLSINNIFGPHIYWETTDLSIKVTIVSIWPCSTLTTSIKK